MTHLDYLEDLKREHNKYLVLSKKRDVIIKALFHLEHTIEELSLLRHEHKQLMMELQESLHKSSEILQKYFYAATI